ncbi:UvrD family DEAD/DEAH box helicase [Actinoplanes sp. NPDC048967]|uniref:UvrD family DEAD/DEAH box helicase n=1 Tax=Actinoplanes sp. NPDC048967 TaxID=3155269 RepID=UPI0033CBEEDB
MSVDLATAVLTDEQRAVVEQPADAAVLVTAGAGAGKTHVLMRRIDRLTGDGGLRPQEILVLSFSRAAVREITERLGTLPGGGRYVRAQTFDSWALRILVETTPERDWTQTSFDERITSATLALGEGRADDLFEDLRHVIVDEVQDLVGCRRQLVQELLERFDCGFTVVGDAAQSIYGFQVKDPDQRAREAGLFVRQLRDTFASTLVQLTLTQNFRAGTDEARTALEYGPLLRRAVDDGDPAAAEAAYRGLRDCLGPPVLDLGALTDRFVLDAVRSHSGTTAILCRTNGEALLAAEALAGAGVAHTVTRDARDRIVPIWIDTLFRSTGRAATRDQIEQAVTGAPGGVDGEVVWRSLLRVAPGPGGRSVALDGLRALLAARRLPDEFDLPRAPVVVSSFHRAKGLEFDRVLVADPGPLRDGEDVDGAEAARALYVALTRTRRDLLRLDPLGRWDVRKDDRTGRWARYSRNRLPRGVELLAGDVHVEEPAGLTGFTADPAGMQRTLRQDVVPGDAVVLERLHDHSSGEDLAPEYLVVRDGDPIAVMSDAFRAALHRLMKRTKSWTPLYPRTIRGVRVQAVVPVAGSRAAGERAGLGPHGVWLAPRLVGLASFDFDRKEDQ